ncbi:aminoglycoside phosphotransferase [Nocardioides sp. GY 10113]|uniref:phosphotransferase enzyme family protein n=1 Tax=Nocardioides sp. GY 10113 TaxID=2569761 RepID=UPI0010A8DA2C|nr:phosphotransferase [Nocardioides sp. GY 10113]TIC88872.1 aminoglycoside phosphotransferase [Nocardioides sp. GY 10113]
MLTERAATAAARQALQHYGIDNHADLRLISLSENGTYLVRRFDGAEPRRLILRVHRPGYQTLDSIHSELTWMDRLREDAGIPTPRVVSTAAGARVADLGEHHRARFVVAFTVVDGVTGEEATDRVSMAELGAITAGMHRHATAWARPPGFERFAWDVEACLGPQARWGSVSGSPGVRAVDLTLLGGAADVVRGRLAAYGRGPDRYGLIHADLRLANLMLDPTAPESTLTVIDFDDCGFGWFLYDLAAAISWLEHEPATPDAIAEWLAGYQEVRPLSDADLSMIPTLVMLRRLMLTAWLGSHPDSPPAQEWGDKYAAGTVDLARRYLMDRTWLRFAPA